MFKDGTDCIRITFFDNNVSKVFEVKGYQMKNVRVSLFKFHRILITTETTDIMKEDNFKYKSG